MRVDFHTHVFPAVFREKREAFFSGEPAFKALYFSPEAKLVGVEELLRNMDHQGIQKSVIFGFPWEVEGHYRRHNDYIIESVQKYPDRLIGFCCFSPFSSHGPREGERCLDSGLSGVGELAIYGTGLKADTVSDLGEVMALCSQYNVPFLLHVNEPVGHQYPGKAPMNLREIYGFLKAYPLNQIVLAHWGGGILFYALMIKEVKEVLSNVWFDTAASPYLYRPDVYRIAGEIMGFEKILFGSDYPLLKPERYFKEMAAAGLPIHVIEQIAGKNAARLLRLS
jgi:predicted TIM-barrel fold metal-dependent hydrolase